MQHGPLHHNSSGVSSVIVGGTTSFQNELLFLQSLDHIQGTSDVHLHLSVGATEPMKNETEAVKHALTGFLATSGNILSVSSCVEIMTGELIRPSGITDLQSSKLLQGNQISLNGNIENVHLYDRKSGSCMSFQCVASCDHWRVSNICIHVNDDHQMVISCLLCSLILSLIMVCDVISLLHHFGLRFGFVVVSVDVPILLEWDLEPMQLSTEFLSHGMPPFVFILHFCQINH